MNASMNIPVWSDDLLLNDDRTDETHREFMKLLRSSFMATDSNRLQRFQNLLEHTVEHFAQEDRWMLATGMEDGNCHSKDHTMILETMREVEKRALAGDLSFIPVMNQALAQWFPDHAKTKDAGLTQYLQEVGFDTSAEKLADPANAQLNPHGGCGTQKACA
jgi:hemerythrin